MIADANPDLNAMHPVRVELDLADRRRLACDVTDILGSPARPLPHEAARAKFAACGGADALWEAIASLETAHDVASLASANLAKDAARN